MQYWATYKAQIPAHTYHSVGATHFPEIGELQGAPQCCSQYLAGQDSEARSVQSALLQPDQETPLDATCNQQETLSLRLAEHAAPAADSSPAASPDEQPVKQHGHRLSWTWRAFAPLSPAEEHVSRADGW